MGARLKSRQTKILSKTDHLRDISPVMMSFLVTEQLDCKSSISPEGSQHSLSRVAISAPSRKPKLS
jgi:hypothetical protein